MTITKTQKLIQLLQEFEVSDFPESQYIYEDAIPEEMAELIYAELISGQFGVNWQNVNTLHQAGYRVHAGDQDSFGWLTGVIPTKKGQIVYG